MKHPDRLAAIYGGIAVFILVSATITRWIVSGPPSSSEQAGIFVGLVATSLIRYYGGEGCSLSFLGLVGGAIALMVIFCRPPICVRFLPLFSPRMWFLRLC